MLGTCVPTVRAGEPQTSCQLLVSSNIGWDDRHASVSQPTRKAGHARAYPYGSTFRMSVALTARSRLLQRVVIKINGSGGSGVSLVWCCGEAARYERLGTSSCQTAHGVLRQAQDSSSRCKGDGCGGSLPRSRADYSTDYSVPAALSPHRTSTTDHRPSALTTEPRRRRAGDTMSMCVEWSGYLSGETIISRLDT